MKLYYAPGACSLAVHSVAYAYAYAFTNVNWANFLALSLAPYPHLMAYLDRVSQRPRLQDASRAEGLVK